MKSYEWDTQSKMFCEVDDPVYDPEVGDFREAIYLAGYSPEITSEDDQAHGATITVYQGSKEDKPRFYIDLMGQNSGIATLVAKDFIALAETLHQIQGLLSLFAIDQFASARAADQVAREHPIERR